MLLQHAFEASCARLGSKTALVCGTDRIGFDDLHRRVKALSALLQSRGIKAGDRVLLYLDSSIEFALAVHAVLAVGAVFVPLSAQTKAQKLAFVLNDTRAAALLTQASLAAGWQAALRSAPSVISCVVAGPVAADHIVLPWPLSGPAEAQSCQDAAIRPSDLAAIIYTSGTTGQPKGVMLSHRNMCSAWASVQTFLQLRESDTIGLALSPAFSYGLYYLLMGLGLGATVVLERSVAFPIALVQTLVRERVTVFPGVPTLFSAILGLSGLPQCDLSALRLITNAAAAWPEQHIRRLAELLPQATLLSMYGMTECKRISYLPPEQLAARPRSVGRGMPGQKHWLIDEQGQPLPDGSTGELVVSGEHVMLGYWDRPEETAQRLLPGPSGPALHTGDLFRTDEDGWLYFVSRRDDIIKTRGEKVSPREVENCIYALDGVMDCAVTGVDDEWLGQAVRAYVSLKENLTLSERQVIRHCQANLESYMVPKSVRFVHEFPRTESGKILKLNLDQLASAP